MSRKSELKARREALGLSQSDLAGMLGIDTMNVKRWERPGKTEPRPFAFVLLSELESQRARVMDEALNAVYEIEDRTGERPGSIQLTYYHNQEQYDAMGRDEGPFGMANANARAVASMLEDMGIRVEWAYPDDEGNVYHGAARAAEGPNR